MIDNSANGEGTFGNAILERKHQSLIITHRHQTRTDEWRKPITQESKNVCIPLIWHLVGWVTTRAYIEVSQCRCLSQKVLLWMDRDVHHNNSSNVHLPPTRKNGQACTRWFLKTSSQLSDQITRWRNESVKNTITEANPDNAQLPLFQSLNTSLNDI